MMRTTDAAAQKKANARPLLLRFQWSGASHVIGDGPTSSPCASWNFGIITSTARRLSSLSCGAASVESGVS